MEIRVATEEDASSLLEIYKPYVENTAITFEYVSPSEEEFRSRIRNTLRNYPYLVAEENGRILGYAYASVFHGREAYQHSVETSIYVAMEERGRGIGAVLYGVLEEWLKMQRVYNLYACITYADREDTYVTDGSIRFHEKCGYTIVGRHQLSGYKFDRWYGVLWMEKMIGERPRIAETFIPFCEIKK